MKIKHYFGLAVIAAMTASCSSNEDLGTAGPGTGTNESGVGYATFTINLPTTSGTRATTNDQFDGGTASEYAVNDATLLIFKKAGASENDYTFVETVPLGNLEPWKKDNTTANGITTEATITAELKQVTVGKGGDYYAFVILNNKDKDNKDKVSMPGSTTGTYGTWNAAATVKNLIDYEKGFYMANAPEFTTKDVEPTTLVPIKGIYRTKEEAHSNPGTTVHVERGLAKVTVGKNSTSKKDYFAKGGDNATGSNYSSDKVQITNWALDVTNKKSFPAHVTSGLKAGTTSEGETVPAYAEIWSNTAATPGTTAATSRFVSQLSATGAFNRVYWGIDPNYSTEYTTPEECKGAFNILGNAKITGDVAKPQYCLENTFDIDHMKQGQTTRVIFKAKYAPQNDAGVSLAESDGTFYTIGNITTILKEADLKTTVNNAATSVLPGCVVDYDANLKKAGSHVITLEDIKENASSTTHLDGTTTYGTGSKTGADIVTEINDKLGLKAGVGINTYLEGVTYYIARIKHFGDDLTPWKAGDDRYGKNNLKWLGRYGVLRNNWYDLTINTISGPGYPDVPEVKPDTPDDEDTKYISVSVKILDWAKRTQNVDL